MSITVYPYKLTQRELEARLEPGLTVLPGQYLRFATQEPIFGQVREVCALPPTSPGLSGEYRLLIDLLYGTPSLDAQQVVLLNAAQMGHEIQRLQEPIVQPLRFSPDFSAELGRLGALTVIAGDDFVQKYEALQLLVRAIQPHRRLVILDPLGVFVEESGLAIWRAGRNVRLSLQTVGSRSFLDTFGELFAPGLREAALRVVADHLPPMQEFLGFQSLLDWYSSLSVPLKNLIVQNFHLVAQAAVFADLPDQTLDWTHAAGHAVTVLDLSALQEPWRGLFFREAVQSLLEQPTEEVVPVLLYPENYLPNLAQWVQRADEAEFKLIMLASPYVDDALLGMANNRLWVDSPEKIALSGSLTMGLPLNIPALNTLGGANKPIQVQERPSRPAVSSLSTAHGPAEEHEEEQEVHFGFSSFNIPLVDGVAAVPDSELLPSDLEPPLHWLGEAAESSDWLEMSETDEAEALTEEASEAHMAALHPDFIEFEPSDEVEAVSDAEAIAPDDSEAPAEVEPLPPVVDLAAPQAESVPEFLTAAQLSQLLTSSPLIKSVEEDGPFDMGGNFSSVTGRQEDNLAPEPVSKAQDVVAAGHSVSGNMPAEPGWKLSPDDIHRVIPSNADLSAADHFPAPELDMSLGPAQEAPSRATEKSESMPPFPSPEEYVREEFHFDLNPDDVTSYESSAPSVGSHADAPGAPSVVAQSLDEFASFDLPVEPALGAGSHDDEFLGFDSILGAGELISAPEQGKTAKEGAEILSGIAVTDQELDDTLDLIFPNYPAAGQQGAPDAGAAPGPAVRDEPMIIVQKQVELPVSGAGAFRAGERVQHPTYGGGVVQKVIPTEESVVLNIMFDSVGKRLLDPALCGLRHEAVASHNDELD